MCVYVSAHARVHTHTYAHVTRFKSKFIAV